MGKLFPDLPDQSGGMHITADFGGTNKYGAYLFLQIITRYLFLHKDRMPNKSQTLYL
jgi:hypothetical protein